MVRRKISGVNKILMEAIEQQKASNQSLSNERNNAEIGNALLSKAVVYSKEFSSIRKIITSAEYDPDNNWIE